MNIGMTKMSSRGQVVIPLQMRDNFPEGESLIVISDGGDLLLKKATKASKKFKEDMEFARRIEEAYQSYERGEFIKMDYNDFLKEVRKW